MSRLTLLHQNRGLTCGFHKKSELQLSWAESWWIGGFRMFQIHGFLNVQPVTGQALPWISTSHHIPVIRDTSRQKKPTTSLKTPLEWWELDSSLANILISAWWITLNYYSLIRFMSCFHWQSARFSGEVRKAFVFFSRFIDRVQSQFYNFVICHWTFFWHLNGRFLHLEKHVSIQGDHQNQLLVVTKRRVL